MIVSIKFFDKLAISCFFLYFLVLILSSTILLTYAGQAFGQNASPPLTINASKTFRIAVIGDLDSNPGLTEQLDLMNKYHVQTLLLAGDFEYTDGKAVLDDLTKHGFSKNNSDIVLVIMTLPKT